MARQVWSSCYLHCQGARRCLRTQGRHIDIPVLSGRDELDGDAGVIDFYAA